MPPASATSSGNWPRPWRARDRNSVVVVGSAAGRRRLSTLATLRLRLGERLAGQHAFTGGRVIYERRDDGRDLHQVAPLDAIVDVHVGVMRARLVLDRVLDELEAWKSHGVEAEV